MEVITIKQADLWGYALYMEWREEQRIKACLSDHLDDPEMERLCHRVVEWPWDRIVGNG